MDGGGPKNQLCAFRGGARTRENTIINRVRSIPGERFPPPCAPFWPAGFPVLAGACKFGTAWGMGGFVATNSPPPPRSRNRLWVLAGACQRHGVGGFVVESFFFFYLVIGTGISCVRLSERAPSWLSSSLVQEKRVARRELRKVLATFSDPALEGALNVARRLGVGARRRWQRGAATGHDTYGVVTRRGAVADRVLPSAVRRVEPHVERRFVPHERREPAQRVVGVVVAACRDRAGGSAVVTMRLVGVLKQAGGFAVGPQPAAPTPRAEREVAAAVVARRPRRSVVECDNTLERVP